MRSSRRPRELAPPGEIRLVATTANLQPAVAIYLRSPGESRLPPRALETLQVEDGWITEVIDFDPSSLSLESGLQPVVAPKTIVISDDRTMTQVFVQTLGK